MHHAAKTPRRTDAGAGTAEMAVAMPLLMALILLIVQFGIWAHTEHVAHATAAEALAAARVDHGTAAEGRQRAEQVRAAIGRRLLAGATITVTRTATTARVEITATAPRAIPLPFRGLPIHVTVTGPIERFRPADAARSG